MSFVSKRYLSIFKCLFILVPGLVLKPSAILADSLDEPTSFEIDAQALDTALIEFSEQADIQLVVRGELVADLKSDGLRGEFTPRRALAVLLDDTGLTYTAIGEDSVAVATEQRGASDSKNLSAGPTPVLMVQNTSQMTSTETSGDDGLPLGIEEIIVVGTKIRGASPVGSKPIVLDRVEIASTGLATAAEVIQSLPQTVGAGANEATSSIQGTGNGAEQNLAFGSTINLRGLGADKTLTLINGRRASAGGRAGGFVDISMIPLTAVERVEVLADGASALYGSDAIAGVVNIVLRDDYDGAETILRFTPDTGNDFEEGQFGQTFGRRWENGNALLIYEYFRQKPLFAEDRGYTANSDLTSLGGDNFNQLNFANPGTLEAGGQTFAIPAGQDGTSLTPADLVAGTSNTQNTRIGTTILPDQERHSVFATVSQEVSDRVELFAEGRYSKREFETRFSAITADLTVLSTNPFFVDPVGGLTEVDINYNFVNEFGGGKVVGEVETLNLTAGAFTDLGRDWNLEVFAAYGQEETSQENLNQVNLVALNAALADTDPATAFNPFGDGSNTNPSTIDAIRGYINTNIETELSSVNAKADGALFDAPGGTAKLAIGAEYREESYRSGGVDFRTTALPATEPESDLDRDVFAAFTEILIPLVGERNGRPGLQRFEVSAAVRFEDYSDFGTTTNPKFGIEWAPTKSLTLRGTFGESFRAPLLTEIDPNEFNGFAFPFPDPGSATGISTVMFLFGDNPDLQPEEADTWTAGFDLAPESISGFNLSATYFDIELTNRIASLDVFTALSREDEFAAAITRNPDPAIAQEFIDMPGFNDFGQGLTGADIEVILDARLINAAITNLNGIDFNIGYSFATERAGSFSLGLAGSHILEFEEGFTPTSPVVDTVDTVGRQVDLQARGSLDWSRSGLSAAAYIYYTDGYKDDVSNPERSVDSWITVDLNLSYDTGDRRGAFLDNIFLSVLVQNLFNEDPPFVNNVTGVGYDPANANPLGRVVALRATKQW